MLYNVFRSTVGEYADAIHQESPAVGCPLYDHRRGFRSITLAASYRR
ncbi:MAG: hypothetical protein LBQ66_09685 [Planctomycetaceae bacterium]|nr:hypothetical protein [Planctomycetaceae bacterium]